MLKLKVFLPIGLLILGTTTPVRADWQFTKWGMTPSELEKASPTPLASGDNCPVNNSNASSNRYDVKYSSELTVGSMNFTVCYLFEKGTLRGINLHSQSVDEEAIIKGLSQRYGRPLVNKTLASVGLVRYQWDLPDEEIEFSVFPSKHSNYPYLVSYRSKDGTDENAVRQGL